ncbi:hypothetical protein TNCV_1963361 [Trichonephila clavipes]|nr:hypothetical protein TNCV_1963361 [Trichonephila clavipes]
MSHMMPRRLAFHSCSKEASSSTKLVDYRTCRPKCFQIYSNDNMLTKYQMVQFIDFCEVWFLPESVARVVAIVGDHHCHTPRH